MKYIEELSPGDCFTMDNNTFILTSDFKSNGNKLCYSLMNGFPKWFSSQDVVTVSELYTLDDNNNTVPIKPKYQNVSLPVEN